MSTRSEITHIRHRCGHVQEWEIATGETASSTRDYRDGTLCSRCYKTEKRAGWAALGVSTSELYQGIGTRR